MMSGSVCFCNDPYCSSRTSVKKCKLAPAPQHQQQHRRYAVALAGSSRNTKPKPTVSIFPEELWELILDQLDDSEAISNVLQAFPHLHSPFQGRRPSWLFGQVYPLLFKYTRLKDLLPCRGVSKRWKHAIDTFLHTHSLYPLSNDKRGNPLHPTFLTQYQPPPCFNVEIPHDMNRFFNHMVTHVDNPFLGRAIALRYSPQNQTETLNTFLAQTLTFFGTFGHHIWHLQWELGHFLIQNASSFVIIYQKVMACLSFLPNLHSLKLGLGFTPADDDFEDLLIDSLIECHSRIPHFPYLQSLDITSLNMPQKFVRSFLKSYSNNGHIRKLELNLQNWRTSLKDHFPHVCELVLIMGNSTLSNLQNILNDLNSPSLKKLVLLESRAICIKSLFTLLTNLRHGIDFLDIRNDSFFSRPGWGLRTPFADGNNSIGVIVPSIRVVRMIDSFNISFDFLKALPFLQHLLVTKLTKDDDVNYCEVVADLKGIDTNYPLFFGIKLRRYLYSPEEPGNVNVWDELPSLMVLTVETRTKGDVHMQFYRETGNQCFIISADKRRFRR